MAVNIKKLVNTEAQSLKIGETSRLTFTQKDGTQRQENILIKGMELRPEGVVLEYGDDEASLYPFDNISMMVVDATKENTQITTDDPVTIDPDDAHAPEPGRAYITGGKLESLPALAKVYKLQDLQADYKRLAAVVIGMQKYYSAEANGVAVDYDSGAYENLAIAQSELAEDIERLQEEVAALS